MANPVTIQPVKPSKPVDVAACRPVNVKSKFEEGMDKLLAILMSGFTNADHDVRLTIRGNRDPNGLGRSETSIWTDPRTQVRLLQNKTATKTDMRSIVSRTLEDGSRLSVTTASQHNSRGQLTALWTRYTKDSTLGADREDAKKTLAKLLNVPNMDTTKDVQIKDEARVICNNKGERVSTEFTKTITYYDTNGKKHEQKIIVTTDKDNKQIGVKMELDGNPQPLPANSDLIAKYVQHDVRETYYDNESAFAELANLGDYGAYDEATAGEVRSQPTSGDLQKTLDTLAKILKQVLAQFSQNGPQSIDQVFQLLNMVNNVAAQASSGQDVSSQIASLQTMLANR